MRYGAALPRRVGRAHVKARRMPPLTQVRTVGVSIGDKPLVELGPANGREPVNGVHPAVLLICPVPSCRGLVHIGGIEGLEQRQLRSQELCLARGKAALGT